MSLNNASHTRLPVFPNFTFLEAHHQTEIADVVKLANGHYSDYNFISLWSWDHQNNLQICLLNNNLVIRFHDYLQPSKYFYSFFGNQSVDATAKALLDYEKKRVPIPELKLIPQFVIESLEQPEEFLIAEDRDSFDYIVAIKNSVDFKEHSASKRRLLNKFLREQEHYLAVEELDIAQPVVTAQIMEVFQRWQRQSNSDDAHQANELRAIRKLLENQHHIQTDNLHVLGIFLGGELSAFSINEIVEETFGIGHFKKAVRDYKGLGEALDHYTAKSLLDKGVRYLNHEQDLGIEGLRQAKIAGRPLYFLKKYTLSLAAGK